MKAAYIKPELEILVIAAEAGFAISQPHGGELGPGRWIMRTTSIELQTANSNLTL